jgi:hypothetical protein
MIRAENSSAAIEWYRYHNNPASSLFRSLSVVGLPYEAWSPAPCLMAPACDGVR